MYNASNQSSSTIPEKPAHYSQKVRYVEGVNSQQIDGPVYYTARDIHNHYAHANEGKQSDKNHKKKKRTSLVDYTDSS